MGPEALSCTQTPAPHDGIPSSAECPVNPRHGRGTEPRTHWRYADEVILWLARGCAEIAVDDVIDRHDAAKWMAENCDLWAARDVSEPLGAPDSGWAIFPSGGAPHSVPSPSTSWRPIDSTTSLRRSWPSNGPSSTCHLTLFLSFFLSVCPSVCLFVRFPSWLAGTLISTRADDRAFLFCVARGG